MKIFLPFIIKDIGGTSTFAKKFSQSLQDQDITVSSDFSFDFDILFIIADCPIIYLFIAKLLHKKIVQRLDGVYHPATPAGKWYWLYNLKMKLIYNFFADTIIYQSNFSKLSCEKFLGKTRAKKTVIIYNGVDLDAIPTKKDFTSHSPIKLLTFAKFRRRDQIEPIIESVKLLDPEQYSLDIYGSYTNNLDYLFDSLPSHIRFQGKKSNKDLLQILHQYDIFLFSDQSACPNSVIEAMAAGLPVIAFDRGSIRELITKDKNGYWVATDTSTQFYNPYPFLNKDYVEFSKTIQRTAENIKTLWQQTITVSNEIFDIRIMIKAYRDILTLF